MEAYAVGPQICGSGMVTKSPSVRVAAGWTSWSARELTGSSRYVRFSSTKRTELGAQFGGGSVNCRVPEQRKRFSPVRDSRDVNILTTDDAAPSSDLNPEFPGLVKFITSGVLAENVGLTPEKIFGRLGEWMFLANKLSDFLNFQYHELSEAEVIRLYQYYLPVFFWCLDQLAAHRSRFAPGEPIPPLVIGINAPQGCGKTTVVESLEFLFNSIGRSAAAVSVDDFYLTGADQDKLAADNPDNGLLEFRGNAGSHDLALGTETLRTLFKLTSKGSKAKVPRYDKAARKGQGDRADPSSWPEVEGPLEVLAERLLALRMRLCEETLSGLQCLFSPPPPSQVVVFFEGWMLGYEPQETEAVTAVDPQLALVNKYLEGYGDAWYSFINSWMIIKVGDPNWVFDWRLEAEVRMRKKGRGGMTDEQIAEFVSRYIPGYKAYLPSLYSAGPRNSTPDNTLQFSISKDRNPIP